MRTLVIGDIHGGYKALLQCLERSDFDYKNDRLIQLGDIADGYPEVYEVVEELLKIENLIAIKGNHDDWFAEFIRTDFHPFYWTYGGKGTLISYLNKCGKTGRYFATGSGYKTSLVSGDIPQAHMDFFQNQTLYYIDNKKRCFLHAGFKRDLGFNSQKMEEYFWNRDLWSDALKYSSNAELKKEFNIATKFKEIYIGHTRTPKDKPLKLFNIINIDTGAGHAGKLTIMDINKKVFWQSDPLPELYPENFRDQ
ncbi:metallophosphoesterase [Pedobacter borealis]|uniref:metallophosphoesterase n=1 Tax=Pedobacter borealis TaxID=475254 RepID=UPI0004932A26|nr:metallophosphoesterase [Pedobacter borealis]